MKLDVLTIAIVIFALGVCASAMDLQDTFTFAKQYLPEALQQTARQS